MGVLLPLLPLAAGIRAEGVAGVLEAERHALIRVVRRHDPILLPESLLSTRRLGSGALRWWRCRALNELDESVSGR